MCAAGGQLQATGGSGLLLLPAYHYGALLRWTWGPLSFGALEPLIWALLHLATAALGVFLACEGTDLPLDLPPPKEV